MSKYPNICVTPTAKCSNCKTNIINCVVIGELVFSLLKLVNKLRNFFFLQYTTDNYVPELSTVYHPGQSVIVKITERDTEKHRFLGSLRMTDCYHGDTEIGLGMLSQYLEDMDMVHSKLQDRNGRTLSFH